jgi:hypothetical protein
MALAVTLAYDYGLVTQARDLHVAALALTFLSLTGGGITSAAFGGLSLRRNFVAGVLQGWLWPIVGAIGDLVLLMNFRNLIRELPFKTDPEILLAFVLCSAIAPTLLTVGAILTSRSLEGTGAGAAPEP